MNESYGNIIRATLTLHDWRIVFFGANIETHNYLPRVTNSVAEGEEFTLQYDLHTATGETLDTVMGRANDLGLVEIIDYADREGDPETFDRLVPDPV